MSLRRRHNELIHYIDGPGAIIRQRVTTNSEERRRGSILAREGEVVSTPRAAADPFVARNGLFHSNGQLDGVADG